MCPNFTTFYRFLQDLNCFSGYTQNVQMVQYGHRSLGMVQMKEIEKSFRLS